MGNYFLLARNQDSGMGSFPGDLYRMMGIGASPTAVSEAQLTPVAEHQLNIDTLGNPYRCRQCPAAVATSTSSREELNREPIDAQARAAWSAQAGERDQA